MADAIVSTEAARSVAGRELPPPPRDLQRDENGNWPVSIVLFYQYIEPAWTETEHRAALNSVIKLAKLHRINGRGRCAPEGLNCTLSGAADDVRAFCQGLRDWNKTFEETDFKITDGVYFGKRFKALTIRKVDELVAYGLSGEKAPSLNHSSAHHVEAHKYHEMMTQEDTVIIDVRNAYESAIGHFQPPPGGAELIDPKMRNSHEFPKWLNMPETKKRLEGKKVMMYCTGGIRCERASALLDQMERSSHDVATQGIYMVRGGIERYLKTFPQGGFWKGYNYLFDRRFEQRPAMKTEEELARDTESRCCLCGTPWNKYRGQYKCREPLCKVPVLVCFACADAGKPKSQPTYCPLCVEGHDLRAKAMPDMVAQKQQLFGGDVCAPPADAAAKASAAGSHSRQRKAPRVLEPSRRVFVGNLPLLVAASDIRAALEAAAGEAPGALEWIRDRSTGAFFGSIFVGMSSVDAAKRLVAAGGKGIRLAGAGGCKRARLLRVSFAPYQGAWPPAQHVESELPPLGPPPAPPAACKGDGDVETLSGDGGGGGGAGAREGASTVKVLETDKAFRKCLRRSDRQLVVVCFSAQWCGPCKQMAPAFAALAQRHQTARFFQIDADQTLPTIADAYSVSSLPTFIFFKNRAPVKTVTGASAQVREALAALVSTLSAQCDLGSKKHTLDEDGDEDEKPGDDKMKRRRVHACPV